VIEREFGYVALDHMQMNRPFFLGSDFILEARGWQKFHLYHASFNLQVEV